MNKIDKEITNFYNGVRVKSGYIIHPYNIPVLKWINRLGIDNKRILDMGCGGGAVLKELRTKSNSAELYGVDLSSKYLEQAKIGAINITYKQHNIEFMPFFKDKTFDIIIAHELFEHLKNPKKVVEECYRLLKDDGFLMISLPWDLGLRLHGLINLEFRLFKDTSKKHGGHINNFGRYKKVKKLFKNYFEIIEYTTIRSQFTQLAIHRVYKLKKVQKINN